MKVSVLFSFLHHAHRSHIWTHPHAQYVINTSHAQYVTIRRSGQGSAMRLRKMKFTLTLKKT